MGNIELADAEHLKELTHRLYNHLYANYSEMAHGGLNNMVDDIMVLDSERIIAQLTKQVTEEVTQRVTEEVTQQVTKNVKEKNKEIIHMLCMGKSAKEIADELQEDVAEVMEIELLLKG